jgi:hypothetical protein
MLQSETVSVSSIVFSGWTLIIHNPLRRKLKKTEDFSANTCLTGAITITPAS